MGRNALRMIALSLKRRGWPAYSTSFLGRVSAAWLVQTRRLVSLSPADRRRGHEPTVRFSTGRRKDVHVGVVRRVSENVSAGLEEQRVTI
jgi:hypothetical protein